MINCWNEIAREVADSRFFFVFKLRPNVPLESVLS